MIRNLKALGLALGAVFAFSAMAASSASAVDTITGPAGNIPITATNVIGGVHNINKFAITGVASVECTTAHFTGTTTSGSSQITVLPTYTGTLNVTPHTTHCSSTLGPVTVDMNGCGYILTGNTTGSDEGTDATVWIECPAGNEIKLTATELGVTLSIHEQTPTSGGVTYTQSGNNVKVKATATGITYSCAPAFLCGLGGVSTEANNSTYKGEVLASSTAGKIEMSGS